MLFNVCRGYLSRMFILQYAEKWECVEQLWMVLIGSIFYKNKAACLALFYALWMHEGLFSCK